MKKTNLWAAIALTMMALTSACSNNDDDELPFGADLALTRAEQQLVTESNDFAFDLFRLVQDERKSQVLSPVSIVHALGMLNNGAVGETQAQICRALGFGDAAVDSINLFCLKMLRRMPNLDRQTQVMIANTIYMNQGYEMLPEFVSKARLFYDATPETRDFHDGKTRDVINQWASDHTEGMIEEVLKEGEFDPDAVSCLLNAIYFKGSWTHQFRKDYTFRKEFNYAGETEELTYCDMMQQLRRFEYAETYDVQALQMPYGNGSFVMTILLPKMMKDKPLNRLPSVPTGDEWRLLNKQMISVEVDVKLPRFEINTDIDLIPIMQKLGMTKAFTPEADFQNFCNEPTFISLMKQSARIKVDEEGTEVAAVTTGGLTTTSIDWIDFTADHPFLYVISEQQTGTVLFIGQYTGY